MTEEGMSDVERDATRELAYHAAQEVEGVPDHLRIKMVYAIIDALSSAGVLGGVPGEKVTVDRADLVVVPTLVRRLGYSRMTVHEQEATARLTAALGGDGGTRPKGTQRFKPETMERMARHMERDQRYDGSPITTDPATEQEKGRMK